MVCYGDGLTVDRGILKCKNTWHNGNMGLGVAAAKLKTGKAALAFKPENIQM
jgi:hypothetical protein